MKRRPPSSTLLPYTTLFRSGERVPRGGRRAPGRADRRGALGDPRRLAAREARARGRRTTPAPRLVPLGVAASRGDRKSTRLNSSHANISYAVFCLKKIK